MDWCFAMAARVASSTKESVNSSKSSVESSLQLFKTVTRSWDDASSIRAQIDNPRRLRQVLRTGRKLSVEGRRS